MKPMTLVAIAIVAFGTLTRSCDREAMCDHLYNNGTLTEYIEAGCDFDR